MTRTTHPLSRLAPALLLVCCAGLANAQSAPGTEPAAPRMRIVRFEVSGNTLLPKTVIEAALERFKGERSVDELKSATTAVQALYAQAGYGGVVAFVPVQAAAASVVAITVVEGKLARVAIGGNQRFSDANVRASLPALTVGLTPQLHAIDAQIQMANENPAKQVQVLLQPGAEAGKVDASVKVAELPLQRWTVTLDNRGNSRTGQLRASLGWQHANLFDRDHVLSLLGQTAPDKPRAVRVLSAGYRVPLYAQRTLLDAYAAWSDVRADTTATVAGDLQFNGRGRLFGVRATHLLPRWLDGDQRIALAFDDRAYLNSCSIGGFTCGPAGESVSVQPVTLEYSMQRGGATPLGVTLGIVRNLQLGGSRSDDARFENIRPGAQAHFTLWRLSLAAGLAVTETWRLQGRLSAQWTADALVPGEQFGIGGVASVRGYEDRELSGDRGTAASLELVGPDLATAVGLAGGSLRTLAFADAGWVGNRLTTPCASTRDECRIGSLGLGARLTSGALQAQFAVAWALVTAQRTERHDARAHVSISYGF